MNGTGKLRLISADTVPERTIAQWIVRDHHDNPWGPFASHDAARKWAAEKWPHASEFDEDNVDPAGWWQAQPMKAPDRT